MHASYLLLVSAAALSHAYLHSLHQAAQQPSWRSLISRGPQQQPHLDHLIRCGDQMTGPTAPSDAVKFATLKTHDLAVAQNKLMAFCDRGGRLAPSGSSQGHVETSGGAFVQLCNLKSQAMPCSKDDVKEMFEAMQCGTKDAPQMGVGAPVPDVMNGMLLEQADWVLIQGPAGAARACKPRQQDVNMGL